jgi:Protein of unknown function (DUF2786)
MDPTSAKSATNKVIERIKKLLELTTSPNEAEAKLAMEQAQKLMAKHSIDVADLKEHAAGPEIIRSEYWNEAFNRFGVWDAMTQILITIPPIFGVYCVVSHMKHLSPTQKDRSKRFDLVGFSANIEITRFALDSLLAQGLADARSEYKKYRTVGFGQSFWSGFASAIAQKFGPAKETSKGIIVYDKVRNYINSIASGSYESKSFSGEAYSSGHSAGMKAELRKGLESKNTGKLLN